MYARVMLVILAVAMPVQGDSYLTIQETVLDSDKINVVFENLIENEWYRFNWTDNPDGYFFQFNPSGSSGQQTKELTLTNDFDRAYFTFYLWYDAGNELLAETTRFWGEDALPEQKPFEIPFVDDIIDFVTSLTIEEIILMVISIMVLVVFNFVFRRGR